MKRLISCLLCLLFVASAVAGRVQTSVRGKWRTYKGAWFDIKYPAGFKVRPSQPSSSSTSGPDSAFFVAPGGAVEFYVFSPQWNGEPSEIEINPATEVYVSKNEEEKDGTKVRRATIKAKNGSYLRSFEDIEYTSNNTRKTFGIKYRSLAAYNKYRLQYQIFKQSLTQYAD